MNDINKITEIDIVSFLSENGYKPKKETPNKTWFCSPMRGETKPSFVVLHNENRWIDFGGDGRTHDIIDLVCEMEGCSTGEAISILKEKKGIKTFEPKETNKDSVLAIKEARDIQDPSLIAYLQERNIAKWCYEAHTKEIEYFFAGNPEQTYVGVGFANDMSGWEVRNYKHKYCISPKSFTFIENGGYNLNIMEGFFDHMSALCHNDTLKLPGDTIILNGLGMLYRAFERLSQYKVINIYLDKGEAADRYISMIRSMNMNVLDHRYIYGEYDDYNDWWKTQNNRIYKK